MLFDDTDRGDFSETFSLPDQYPLVFVPGGASSNFEDEEENEMIKIVNPNKHVTN